MYKLAVAVLILSVATANVHNKGDTFSILAEVDKDVFGNTLLSLVQTQLKAKGSADEVNILLNGLLQNLNADQHDQDEVNRTAEAACRQFEQETDQAINYHTAQINANVNLRDDTQNQLDQAEADLRTVIADSDENVRVTGREQATREDQHSVWAGKDAQLTSDLAAVDDATKLVQHLQLGSSFAQVKTKFESISKTLKEKSTHQALFKPIVNALVELQTHLDQKAVQRIAQLLSELRSQLVEEQNELKSVEDKQAHNWEEFHAHLTEELARLSTRKVELESQISQNKEDIGNANEFIEHHTIELEDQTTFESNRAAWCERYSTLYGNQTADRQRQIDIIYRIQDKLLTHLASSAQYLQGRTGK